MAFQLKVVSGNTNLLLNRKEVQLEITHANQALPTKNIVTHELSSNYSIPSERIYIYNMKTKPGLHKTVACANMYNNFDDLKKIEKSFVVTRITGEKAVKPRRREKKIARIKRYKMFSTLKRNMKKAVRRAESD